MKNCFSNPLITVIIPVKNGEATLAKCLAAIKGQTIADKIEIIILDSDSTDKSTAIAGDFNAKVVTIPNGTFNHGLTRNAGVAHAQGELLYFTVQDAYLSENDQLEKMCAHFYDPELQAVVGMQATPHDTDKNPARWFARFTKPETVYRHFPDGSFSWMAQQEQFTHCSWDNVNAMYRKLALQKIPFVKTDFSEDWLWVKDALTAKMKIAFDPSLLVYHYHHRDFGYSFKVQYIMNYNFFKQFSVYPSVPPFIKPVLSDTYRVWKNSQINVKNKLYWTIHNFMGTSGVLLSHLMFIITGKIFGRSLLNKSFHYFCDTIPQGKVKQLH